MAAVAKIAAAAAHGGTVKAVKEADVSEVRHRLTHSLERGARYLHAYFY